MTTNFSQTAAYIWSLADLLRGDFKQSQYGRVILPFTILRRLESTRRMTLIVDEYWKHVKAAGGESGLESGVQASMMEMYSGATSVFPGRIYADPKKNIGSACPSINFVFLAISLALPNT